MEKNKSTSKTPKNPHIHAIKLKTESNTLGLLKTMIVLFLIMAQFVALLLFYLYFVAAFQTLAAISVVFSFATCIYVLSTNKNGQVKATWIMFLIICFTFGYIIYFLSDEHILFASSKRKYKKIFSSTKDYIKDDDLKIENQVVKNECNYLKSSGDFKAYSNQKIKYFESGYKLFDDIIENLKRAKKFIFMEYFIISDGVLLNRILDVLTMKAKEGVDVRIIYDDMGSHGTLKLRTKTLIKNSGIKLQDFNRLIPWFNIALNLRDHRKIVVIDGITAYTGGANLADEYINEKRMHGYWKDSGIKIEGQSVDNFTLAFIRQWEFLTNSNFDYKEYFGVNSNKNLPNNTKTNSNIVVPFVDGMDFKFSIGRDMYINLISNANKKLYIMTPYFIPDDAIVNLLIAKAESGVDIKIILPDVADKKFVYTVSRNNAEKLLEHNIKIYTMTHSFVHSKIVLNENSVIVGSINMDQRSFYQQFESAIYTTDFEILKQVENDFDNTISYSLKITPFNMKRRKLTNRMVAGLFRIISPFM